MNVFRRNIGYKLLSVAVAVLLYFVAFNQLNPRRVREILVQPEVVGLSQELAFKQPLRGYAITVTGPATVVDNLRKQSVKVTMDLTQAKEGNYVAPIYYQFPAGVRSRIDLEAPMSSEVVLVRKIRRPYVVDVLHNLTAPVGYEYQTANASPREVSVVGLPAELAKVARVVAKVTGSANEGAIDRAVVLTPEDIQKRSVDSVTIEPEMVRVRIPLRRAPTTKMVLLSASLSGEPAPGHTVAGYTFTPRMVTVSGPQEKLATLSSMSVTVDISGIRETGTRTVRLTPPRGVTLESSAIVSVRLEVKPLPVTAPLPTPEKQNPAEEGSTSTPPPAGTNEQGTSR